MQISGKTDIGQRRAENQDSFATGTLPSGGVWAIVCDGMGGHAGGSTASTMAAECIADRIKNGYSEKMPVQSVKNMIESAIMFANAKIYNTAEKNPELSGMGTTVVVALCFRDIAVIAWAGDSRCYICENDNIIQLTRDHSLVQELVDSGNIAQEDADYHPMKNVITRALGLEDDIQVDFTEVSFGKSETTKKMLLLCTDGLSNLVSDDKIAECMCAENTEESAEKLVCLANENGGRDNITAVVIAEN